ncbi:MAG: 50S ribosomal protein L3 N(5)-glutamine methyltransferase [Burkholderiales bacterium]|nr:50S ribosomal protein L3 N(5)-glutamine methyltransferase [Burkholderiales bacterium]
MNIINYTTPLRTVRDFIRYALTQLKQSEATFGHGYDDAEHEAVFLVLGKLSIPLEYEEKFLDAAVCTNERDLILQTIARRCDDLVPTAYLVKEWWLVEHPFYVDERVIIPRSYIAELLEDGLEPWVKNPEEVHSILDLCTGGGSLAILAAEAFPHAEVVAADISQPALEVAEINIDKYHLQDRVKAVQSDVFSNLEGKKFDFILSNPPYVTDEAIRNLPIEYLREPAISLKGGADGMDIVEKIVRGAKEHLNDKGFIIIEIGNGKEAFEKHWPSMNVTWLNTSGGDYQVVLIFKEDLP